MRKMYLCSYGLPAALAIAAVAPAQVVQTPLAGSAIAQFVDPLPLLDLAASGTAGIDTLVAGAGEIELHMREFQASVMPTGFVPATGTYTGTWVFGYINGPTAPAVTRKTYTGPVIVATRNLPTQIRFVNDLGHTSTSPVLAFVNSTDQTLHWADPLGDEMNMCNHMIVPGMPPMSPCDQHYNGWIPAVPHLHGGYVPPNIDGGPDAWFTSDGTIHGHGYYTKGFKGSVPSLPTLPDAAYPPGAIVFSEDPAQKGFFINVANVWQAFVSNQCVYRYPNGQEAALIWFHDHLLGGTRINVYCGLAGAFDLIDPGLVLPTGINAVGLNNGTLDLTSVLGPSGANTELAVPLVIQDRSFDVNGQLLFPNVGINPEHPYWVPEFMGDTICVNGKVWPYLSVQAKRYRFLIINGSNARPYELSIPRGPAIWQIGTDGGYLDTPVQIAGKLVLLPGERADIIIDFAGFGGKTMLMTNTAPAPYPAGTNPNPLTTGRIMQFKVAAGAVTDNSYNPATLTPLRPPMVRLVTPATGALASGVTPVKTRQMTLNEIMGMGGPLEILVNNTKWDGKPGGGILVRTDFQPKPLNGKTDYHSEVPDEGTTEVWEIVNLTADTHPMHTHLTQFQLLNRQAFKAQYATTYAASFPGGCFIPGFGPPLNYDTGNPRAVGGNPDITPFLAGAAVPPATNEAGWKDTIQCPPGWVTRFVMRFAPQDKAVNAANLDFPFDPNALGYGYVWHCHIVDHEDNEMMRPYSVAPDPAASRTYVQGVDY